MVPRNVVLVSLMPFFLGWVEPAPAADLKTQVDQAVEPFVKEGKVVGLVVGVMTKDGARVYAYGKTTREGDQAPDGDTLFEIGSLTKLFTVLVLADLVEQGQLKLDDPIRKYLPATYKLPKDGDQEITFLHLATHTSGLPRIPISLALKGFKNPYAEYGEAQLQETLAQVELVDFGTRYRYSNLGMGLLGHTLAVKEKTSYENLVVKRVCGPLGMKDTRIQLSPDQQKRLAPGHSVSGAPVSNWDFQALAGAGALRSTVNDLLKFMAANLGQSKTPLQPAIAACHQPRHAAERKGKQVGLAWSIARPDGKTEVLGHSGSTGGYSSTLLLVKDQGLGVVVLSNTTLTSESITERVAVSVLKVLLPAP